MFMYFWSADGTHGNDIIESVFDPLLEFSLLLHAVWWTTYTNISYITSNSKVPFWRFCLRILFVLLNLHCLQTSKIIVLLNLYIIL